MNDVSELNKPVLVLNKGWSPLNVMTVRKAIQDCMIGSKCAIDHESYMVFDWEGWFNLPVEEGHRSIRLTRGKRIRVPELIVTNRYSKLHSFTPKLNKRNIWLRDGGVCQYTGEKVPYDEATKDHIIPSSRGGSNTWENLVLCTQKINEWKADRTPEEAGLKLLKKPTRPKSSPIYRCSKFSGGYESWSPFLKA